jgi:hypothetical protein
MLRSEAEFLLYQTEDGRTRMDGFNAKASARSSGRP